MLFGSDPEFFAIKSDSDGSFCIPPVYFHDFLKVKHVIPGKKHPVFIKTPSNILIHQDGAAFEFKIPPFKTAKELYSLINEGWEYLNNLITKYGFDLYIKPVINFSLPKLLEYKTGVKQDLPTTEILDILGGEHFWDCVQFGCDKDWDAWDYIKEGSQITDVTEFPYRSGGGHIHTSGNDLLIKDPLITIRLMSLYLGNYFTAHTMYPEQEKIRAIYYGKPGKFRPQKYPDGSEGIEYRTPSNSWLSFPIEQMQYMLDLTEKVVEVLKDPKKTRDQLIEYGSETILAIVNCNQSLSKSILSSLGV